MSGQSYIEVTVGGTTLVGGGLTSGVILEEELDSAAMVSVDLVPDPSDASKLAGVKVGATVTVALGTGASPTRTIACTLVETEDELDSEGRWTSRFRAVDALVKLKNLRQSRLLEVSPQAVISQVASDHGLSAQATGIEAFTQPILQDNRSDAGLLHRLSTDFGYRASLDGTSLRIGRSVDTTSVTVTAADQVGRIRVRRAIADIPSQVKVIGYDWKSTQAAVVGVATGSDLANRSGGTTATALVEQAWGTVTLLVESERLLEAGDAAALARGTLQRVCDGLVQGTLECNGRPDARPGRPVVIQGFGAVSGTYRIRATRHRLDASQGYRTEIEFDSDSVPSAS